MNRDPDWSPCIRCFLNIKAKAEGDKPLFYISIPEDGIEVVLEIRQHPPCTHIGAQAIDKIAGVQAAFEFFLPALPVNGILKFLA